MWPAIPAAVLRSHQAHGHGRHCAARLWLADACYSASEGSPSDHSGCAADADTERADHAWPPAR
eukprot:2438848-Alexandrium_andersonii.AAC.1